jgi:hypothetical protein
MSSAFDRQMQPSEERMEIVRLQERYKTSTRISKLTIRDMTTEMKEYNGNERVEGQADYI